MSSSQEFTSYQGLVLTSIDVTKAPIQDRPNRVEFPAGVADGTANDDTAVFLEHVKVAKKDKNGKLILEADVVVDITQRDIATSKDITQLFCIHGFNKGAKTHLEECQKAQKGLMEEYNLIPVIWPGLGNQGLLNYFSKRRTESLGAGRAFQTLSKYMDIFPKKALHVHSMGNRVLRYAANAGCNFDNIFMVAADTDNRMFNKDYIEKGGRNEDGLRIAKMIKHPKGKIYVLYNGTDRSLSWSRLLTFRTRLGSTGARENRGKIHPEVQNKISSYNYKANHLKRNSPEHNYHFFGPALEFFKKKNKNLNE